MRLTALCLGIARRIGGAAVAILIASTAVAASPPVDAPTDRQVDFLEDCLAAAVDRADDPGACVGAVAQPCMQRPENLSNTGVVACYQRERAAWEVLRGRFEAQLSGGLDNEEARAALAASAEAWALHRDESCALPYAVIQGEEAPNWAAACQCEKTAARTIDLYRLLPMVGF